MTYHQIKTISGAIGIITLVVVVIMLADIADKHDRNKEIGEVRYGNIDTWLLLQPEMSQFVSTALEDDGKISRKEYYALKDRYEIVTKKNHKLSIVNRINSNNILSQ